MEIIGIALIIFALVKVIVKVHEDLCECGEPLWKNQCLVCDSADPDDKISDRYYEGNDSCG